MQLQSVRNHLEYEIIRYLPIENIFSGKRVHYVL